MWFTFPYREAEIRNTILAQVLDQAARARCEYPSKFLIKSTHLSNSSKCVLYRGQTRKMLLLLRKLAAFQLAIISD